MEAVSLVYRPGGCWCRGDDAGDPVAAIPAVTGPRLLKVAMVSVPVLSAPVVKEGS